MKTKVQFLFDMDKLLKRPTAEQRKVEVENYGFLQRFPHFVRKAFDDTENAAKNKSAISKTFLWFPLTLYGNVLENVATEYPEYLRETGRKSYTIKLRPNYECYIKKLTSGSLLPSYNHSQTSFAMCEGLALPEQEPLPVIFLGYTLTEDNSEITGCYAVCIKGKEKIWVSDLNAIEPPKFGETVDLNPVLPNLPQVKVRVREKKQAK